MRYKRVVRGGIGSSRGTLRASKKLQDLKQSSADLSVEMMQLQLCFNPSEKLLDGVDHLLNAHSFSSYGRYGAD